MEPPSGRNRHVGAWLANWVWVILIGPLFTFIPLTFPDGRLRSRRWRRVVALAIAAMAVGSVAP